MSRPATQAVVSGLHSQLVLNRRLRVLASHAQDLLPATGTALDVGCGNGIISRQIMDACPQLTIQGIDVLKRPACSIPMETYDGKRFPFDDKSMDAVMFMDVLHHTDEPIRLLQEAIRVARQSIVIKDHICENRMSKRILSFMDWTGNYSHGVALPYNYWSSDQWKDAWKQLANEPDQYITNIGLYPWFVKPIFEKGLHFIARISL